MNTNKVGDAAVAAAAADVDNGREEKLTVVVIGAAAAGGTMSTETTMSSTNVKAEAGDRPTVVVVDGKKLKAWLTQLIMWSCVYYLMYWIQMVKIKMDYYGIETLLHGIIPFSLVFFIALVAGGIHIVNMINSLVRFVDDNIIPSPGTFRSSTTTSIDEMKKEIIGSLMAVLLISLIYNSIHMMTMVISKIIVMEFIDKNTAGGSAKADDLYSQMVFAGCIFFVTLLHTYWYYHTISEQNTSIGGVDNGREEKLTVLVIGASAGGTMSTETTMSSTNVKAEAADRPTVVVVHGKKLKAWLTQLIMWSCVYYLMYWIVRLVMIKMDSYGVATFLHGIIPFSLLFFGCLIVLGIESVKQINSLVLFMNNNIIPSPGTFRSSTTTSIDEMKKEIRESLGGVLFSSIGVNLTHIITMGISQLIMELIGTKNKVGGSAKATDDYWITEDWISQFLLVGCIFVVTIIHALWYDHTICEELGLADEAATSIIRHTHTQHRSTSHIDNTTNVM